MEIELRFTESKETNFQFETFSTDNYEGKILMKIRLPINIECIQGVIEFLLQFPGEEIRLILGSNAIMTSLNNSLFLGDFLS